jgi:hypothetical protein
VFHQGVREDHWTFGRVDDVRATSDNKNKQQAKGKTSDIYVIDEYVHT